MSDVTPNFRETSYCGCGCGEFGTLKRPNRKGVRCVARKCKCPSCKGRTSREKGDKKARAGRKSLAIPGANTRHEEHLGGLVRWEAKAGAQIKPMWTAFIKAEAQSEASRAFGDNRPFVMTAAPDGTKDQLFACRVSVLPDVVTALAEQLGGAA